MTDRFASAAARALAAELGVEIDVGSGRGGRVTISDVRAAVPAPPPEELGARGQAFWLAVVRDFDLRPDEQALLFEAASTLDEIGQLEEALASAAPVVPAVRGQVKAHPLVADLRAHRLSFAKLTAALRLVEADEEDADGYGAARQNAGRQLAARRWRKNRG